MHLKKLLNFEALEESIANGEFEKVFPKKRALPPPLRSHQREKEILARGPRRTEGAETRIIRARQRKEASNQRGLVAASPHAAKHTQTRNTFERSTFEC